jgi:hypothetical protein
MTYLPHEVTQWAGLPLNNPTVDITDTYAV